MMRSIFKSVAARKRRASKTDISDSSKLGPRTTIHTSSLWNALPVELQIRIISLCSVGDFLPLKLVCRGFNELLTVNEQAIAKDYLRRRRHGTLPSTSIEQRQYTRNPEDDVVLLSDLFPPSKSAKGGYLYSFRYLHRLRRRQELCGRLAYYLADRVVKRFMETQKDFIKSQCPTKNERNLFYDRGVASFKFSLVPVTYFVLFFFETYSLARQEHSIGLLRDYEAGKIPVRIPLQLRIDMYREMQTKILQSPPFSDDATLIATYHGIRLLVDYLHTASEESGPFYDNRWISALLVSSEFERLVEFFSAEIGDGGNQRMQRREFMIKFHKDLTVHERNETDSRFFESPERWARDQPLMEVFFRAAEQEMSVRNSAMPHDVERYCVWNGLAIIVACHGCIASTGWNACAG